MAKYTEHLRLVKPEGNEYYNVEQFNQNSELIDKETKKLSEGLSKVQEGATKDKKGIVQFGTEEGKALEGIMLARLAGAYGYGGDIQDEGVKNPNYIYYDRNTRKMYKCLKQNQDISANVTNFIPLDNNSLLERLENLFSSGNSNNINWVKLPSGLLIQWGSKMWGEIKLPKSYQSIDSFSVIASKGNPSSPGWTPQSYLVVTGKLGVDKIFIQSYEKGGNIQSNWITLGF